jgi:uncharacterized protein YndB with AHSA1/START domain
MPSTHIVADPGMPQILVSRRFDAPRERVFRAHVEPELVVRWLGPRGLTMTVDLLEARDGGRWRYVHHLPGGGSHAFHGVFHGRPTPDRIVQTWEDEGSPGPVCMSTLTFDERGGGTLLRQNTVFQSVADRDTYVREGMERGVTDSMNRLADLLQGS